MIVTQVTEVCDICNEGISDPICMNCYNKELLTWLKENVGNSQIIIYIMKKLARKYSLDNLGSDYCIICGKENVFICRHCYFSSFKRMMQEINFSNKIINSFSAVFDSDHINKYEWEERYIQ